MNPLRNIGSRNICRLHPAFSKPLLALQLLTLTSCASNQYYDREKDSPEYAERPKQVLQHYDSSSKPNEVTAVAGLLNAVTLGINPNYYKKSTLAGRCVIPTFPEDRLGVPCRNVVILLKNSKDQEVERKPVQQDGAFSFLVSDDQKYWLEVTSEVHKLKPTRHGPYSMGEEVELVIQR